MDLDTVKIILKDTPPVDQEKNLNGLCDLLKKNESAKDKLRRSYPLPFRVIEPEQDKGVAGEKPFFACDEYNRVGDKYRSPWTDRVYPGAIEGAAYRRWMNSDSGDEKYLLTEADEFVLALEHQVNGVWESYKNLYYGHEAMSSVYLRNVEHGTFEGVFCIQKNCSSAGSWSSIHVVRVEEPSADYATCDYSVESTVLCVVNAAARDGDENENESDQQQQQQQQQQQAAARTSMNTSALLSKDVYKTCKLVKGITIAACHIENLGDIIEDNEIQIRSSLDKVHIPKTQEIVSDMKQAPFQVPSGGNPLMGMIMGSDVLKKKQLRDGPETFEAVAASKPTKFRPPAGAVNPLMGEMSDALKKKKPLGGGGAVNPLMGEMSDVLKKKKPLGGGGGGGMPQGVNPLMGEMASVLKKKGTSG